MAKKIELLMPKMGESIQEATVLNWLKQEGDSVELDEPILEIATDKVDSDVPSPVNGKIVKTLYNVDDVVKVGEAVAVIETEDEIDEDIPVISDDGQPSAATSTNGQQKQPEPELETVEATTERKPVTEIAQVAKSEGTRFYSPLVMNIARTEEISMNELEEIPGSGRNGRVTKKDILLYVDDKKAGKVPAREEKKAAETITTAKVAPVEEQKVDVPVYPGDEIIEMDRMRRLISEHMVRSKRTSPHVTSMVEVDMTKIVKWRDRIKKQFEQREGQKITFTPIFIEAVVKAIKDKPLVNVSVAGDKIIKRKNINIGMATALPSGNLIVPVIHEADNLSLLGLTKRVNDLALRARENKLKPEETSGGTFTITNVGTFGNVMGTPVINQPQVAILATGIIQKKPSVIETPDGDFIGIRHKMFISMSYDHRVVDGALGGSFIRRVADYLEAWDENRTV